MASIGFPKPEPRIKIKKKPYWKKGQRTMAWSIARRKLKIKFEAMGIVTCEARLEKCANDNMLSFAHIAKRRKLKEGELYTVILVCIPCHIIIERFGDLKMRLYVQSVIDSRN